MAFNRKTGVALRDMYENLGDEGTTEAIQELLKSGDVKETDFDLREIYEAVSSDMFPKLTGTLINSIVIKGYENQSLIGDRLATTIPSKMEVETIGGLNGFESPEEVQQGAEYNESDAGEKFVTSKNQKFGRLLSLTEETIYFDKSGEIMRRAQKFGMKAALYKERLIVNGVMDIAGYRSYHPENAETDLYSVTNSNLNTGSPFGETGLDTCWESIQGQTDSEGDPILVGPDNAIALVPIQLWNRAVQMQKSPNVPEGTENAINAYKGTYTPLTSPFVTSASSSDWFFGDFKSAFGWLEVWPIQVMQQKPDSDLQFRRDLKAVFKIRLYGSLAALDPVYIQKNEA